MDNFKSASIDFMSVMIEDTLSKLKMENIEYGRYRENERNNVRKIGEILNKLSLEDKQFMENHEMNIFNIAALEQRCLYRQGYINCIKLLKNLGVM